MKNFVDLRVRSLFCINRHLVLYSELLSCYYFHTQQFTLGMLLINVVVEDAITCSCNKEKNQ